MTISTYDELSSTVAERLKHVASRGQELGDAIQDWMAKGHFTAEPTISENRLSWQLQLRVREAPPLEKWGFIFGEAVGGLRSILNNLLTGITKVEGISLVHPKLLQFPIAESVQQWADQKKFIAELSLKTQQAIERIQPFQRSEQEGGYESDPLLMLRRLSNVDKHELALKPVVNPLELAHSLAVEFRSEEEAAAEGEPQVEFGASFEDGAVLVRQVTSHPIVKVRGSYQLHAQVVVSDPPHGDVGITGHLAGFCSYVDQVCGYVLTETSTD